ncbi:hypothetical protein FKW77_000849 [Venturia effusa]|uniref:Adenosine deaminase domain-containing protein n=1 Tax=Venturia effusa TaxID=50376 RepID=A0A517LN85_9PEZI|nr:hypothetical protein FKW77_000849 [Venturia effusa]
MSPLAHLRSFALALPKIELHAHLSGSISRQCLNQIWLRKKSLDPALDLEAPLVAIPNDKVDYDLTSTLQVLADFEADGVVYLELRTTPRSIPQHNITKLKYVEAILGCIHGYEQIPQHRLRTRLILSVDRRDTLEQANEVVELAKSLRHRGVCAVDLCGDPARVPIHHLAPAFENARKAGLRITLHFAESPVSSSDKELWMLLSWRPDRLGHVINVHDEMKKTDDVGVFCSPLSEEYALAAEHFHLAKEDLISLCERVVEITFASEAEKARLRQIYKLLRENLKCKGPETHYLY